MLSGRSRSVVGVVLALVFAAQSANADFDPHGRKRGKSGSSSTPTPARPKSSPPKPTSGATPKSDSAARTPKSTPKTDSKTPQPKTEPGTPKATSETQPPKSPPQASEEGEEGTASGPSDAVLIERYKGIVLGQPGAQFPLQRLVELVRKRDGNLDKLQGEFEARAEKAGPGQYAALIVLGGIFVQTANPDRAVAIFERAVTLEPKNPVALMAEAHVLSDRGRNAEARKVLERALPLLSDETEREQVLRSLMVLAIEADDIDAARGFHRQLVQRAKGSFFVEAELGNELLSRSKLPEAQTEFERVVKVAQGDNRALAPALKDLGRALQRQHKNDEAISVLRRALSLTSAESGLRRELLELLVDVYRDQEKLPEIISLLEKEPGQDFARLRLLGSLYEERGQLNEALATYRKALKLNSKDLEVRQRLVRLLQLQGELDLALEEYRRLTVIAPHNPDFVFQLVESLLQQGKRTEALQELTKLETRSAGDEQVQTALVDFYERLGEQERSVKLLEALAKHGANTPDHLVELGDRYFQAGNAEQAERTWRRLLNSGSRPAALARLGDVYLEHNLVDQALTALEQAVELAPNETRYQKALALALERSGSGANKGVRNERYERALHLWERLLTTNGRDPLLAREARQHMVTLWSLGGSLEARVPPLERNLKTDPPDLESGRLLALIYERLKRPSQAERVLDKVTKLAPGDSASWLGLERVLAAQRKLQPAIDVLAKLVQLDPNRAREYYQRMANYATELYHDDDAIRFASKAVELNPDDAIGHKNLADMYARRHDVERAVSEYRRAISQNDRLFPAYFDLAELLISERQDEEADKLLRRVMRSAGDEELVTRAVRKSAQLNVAHGTAESLEKELLPIALANSSKPIYRRLLIELYGAVTLSLSSQLKSDDAAVRGEAQKQLTRIGSRAVKPLLDALADGQGSEQQVAIELLTQIANENASQALFTYATNDDANGGTPELRVRAMIAAGAPGQVGLLPELEHYLFDRGQPRVDEGSPIAIAAVWGLTQIRSEASSALLLRLLESNSPSAQTLASVALAQRNFKRAEPVLVRQLGEADLAPSARAAAIFALGQLRTKDTSLIQKALSDDDAGVQATAIVAWARLVATSAQASPPSNVLDAIAARLTSQDPRLARAALGAAGVLATGNYEAKRDPLTAPQGRVNIEELEDSLVPEAPKGSASARAIVMLEPALTRTLQSLLQGSPERAPDLTLALLAQGEPLILGQLSRELDSLSSKERSDAEAALARLNATLVGPFVVLAEHPQLEVRSAALQFLAHRSEPAAKRALLDALHDRDPQVVRLALGAIGQEPFLEAFEPLASLVNDSTDWTQRVLVLDVLARFPVLTSAAQAGPEHSLEAIAKLAESDGNAYVREAALRALVALDPEASRPVLARMRVRDPEPRVRRTADELRP